MSQRSASLPLLLEDGQPIDHQTLPPKGCQGDLVQQRPCPKTQCRYHLWPQDERPGRPHQVGARPPTTLMHGLHAVAESTRPSCMYDEIRSQPDGLTADDVGSSMGVVGERVRQVEHRGALKWEAVDVLTKWIEEIRDKMPMGTALELVHAHNEHGLPNQHFVTVVIGIDPKADKRERKAFSGVMVRKRRG